MAKNDYLEAATAFVNYHKGDLSERGNVELAATPVFGGLINNSWRIDSSLKAPFLLQRINSEVFHNPQQVQQNFINIWQYAEFEFTGLQLPTPLFYAQSQTLYKDGSGNFWRAFEFIEESTSKLVAQNPDQAKATAKTFAKFIAAFEDFNLDQLKVVIPNFHNLSYRYKQFEDSLKTENHERKKTALEIVHELKKREQYKHFYDLITESPENFPLRVMHHDAKIANVLFSVKTGKVICAVDFDTVMPGYYFSDLGDIIRSMACTEDENCIDYSRIEIRGDFYNAIVDGYLEVMQMQFTESEKKYIHYSGILMVYMQALRFISDYLNGDTYYQIQYPTQNFDRAFNQLTLLKKLESFLQKHYQFNGYQNAPVK